MTRGLSIAITLGLLAGAARAEDRAAPARELVREALAARALGPVAPPVLPVLVPGSQGEPRPGRETPPGAPPSPGSHPKPAGTPPPAVPGTTAPPAGHPVTHTIRHEAVGPGAQEAHRIRADAANRAAIGAAAHGAATSSAHAGEECHDAAGAMRTMGMDPGHTDSAHHGGMMPDSGGTMSGHH
jgi:hypothetical protein